MPRPLFSHVLNLRDVTRLWVVSQNGSLITPGTPTQTLGAARVRVGVGGTTFGLLDWASDVTTLYQNNATAPDDATKASWSLPLGYAAGNRTSFFYRAGGAGAGLGTEVFFVNVNGDLMISGNNAIKNTGTLWINPSDERTKDNVQPYATGLAAVTALKPSTFTMNGNGGSTAGDEGIGLIAQEVEPVMPEMIRHYQYDEVTGARSGVTKTAGAKATDYLALDQTALTMALINAIKELTARVEALEARPPNPGGP